MHRLLGVPLYAGSVIEGKEKLISAFQSLINTSKAATATTTIGISGTEIRRQDMARVVLFSSYVFCVG